MLLETLHASLRAAFCGRLLTGADAAPFLTDYRGKWTGQALAVVQHIAQLARSLKMRTVCEGVETPEQLAMVIGAGIDEAQGYLLSAPKPLEFFNSFTEDWNTQQAPLEYLPE